MGTNTRKALLGCCLLIASLAAGGMAAGGSAEASQRHRTEAAAATESADVGQRSECDPQRNLGVVLAALRVVFSEHRVDQVDQFFAADFVQHSPYTAPGGREDLKQWWAAVIQAIPDVTTTVSQTTALGLENVPIVANCTDVVTFRTVSGTIAQDLPEFGIVGVGKHVEFRVADIFRVNESGKISAHWEVADTGPLVMLANAG